MATVWNSGSSSDSAATDPVRRKDALARPRSPLQTGLPGLLLCLICNPAAADVRVGDCGAEPTANYPAAFDDAITCRIEEIGDSDTFRFDAGQSDLINVRVFGAAESFDPHLELYGPTGTRLLRDSFGRRQSGLQGRMPSQGAYTLRVVDYGNDAAGEYQVFFERISPPGPSATRSAYGRRLVEPTSVRL